MMSNSCKNKKDLRLNNGAQPCQHSETYPKAIFKTRYRVFCCQVLLKALIFLEKKVRIVPNKVCALFATRVRDFFVMSASKYILSTHY